MRKNVIIAGAFTAMLAMGACNNATTTQNTTAPTNSPITNSGKKIVYINTDSLMMKYNLAIKLNEEFLKKQEERRSELNIKARSFEQEAQEFQKKLQTNAFLSEQRAIEARDNVLVKEQNLQRLQQEMLDKMNTEQQEMTKKLFDKVTAFLKTYTAEKGYDMVLSTSVGGNVLFAVDGYDITNDVVSGLNAQETK